MQNTQNNNQKLVEIFTTDTCHFCHLAKEWFAENNIAYTEHNVQHDLAQRKNMVEMTGQMGVPVIKIENDIIIGFNEDKLKELLEVK